MKERIAKLIDVKSIGTLLMTGVFCYLSCVGRISPEMFITIFTVVIGFYYGSQHSKNKNNNTEGQQ